jgi:peptidoglycan/LPS O-acetylase OafA/YrhL
MAGAATGGDRYEVLDLVRFLAACMVMFYHYLFRGWQQGEFFGPAFETVGPWFRFGYLGVNLFFAISGFVILLSCESKGYRGFIASRFLRLYPAYVMAVVTTWLITCVYGHPAVQTTAGEMLVNLTMFQQFLRVKNVDGVYWTLARELIFYGMVFAFLVAGKIRMFEGFIWLWLAASAMLLFWGANKYVIYSLNADYSGYFSFGASVYFVLKKGFSRGRTLLVLFSLIMMHVQGVIEAFKMESGTGFSHPVELIVSFNSVVVIGFFAVILSGLKAGKAGSVFAALGLVSYPLYLLHAHIGYVFLDRFLDESNGALVVPLCVIMILLMSFALTYLWERPVRNILQPWVHRMLGIGAVRRVL